MIGTGIQIVGYDMRRGADDLYAPHIGLMVRLGADERGQERVVNINDPVAIMRHKLRRQNTHVLGQHNIFRRVRIDHFSDLFLVLRSVEFFVADAMERYTELLDQRAQRLMVGNYSTDLRRQFAGIVPDQEIAQAVRLGFARITTGCFSVVASLTTADAGSTCCR